MRESGYRQYFTDTVTVYHRTVDPETKADTFERVAIPGVMIRKNGERTVNPGGIVKMAQMLKVTLLPDADPGDRIQEGDYLLAGIGPELTDRYTLKDLRREYPSLSQISLIADNRSKPYLKHRRVECG